MSNNTQIASKTQHINIGNTDLPIIEYKSQRVITFSLIEQAHQRPDGTAKRNFNKNRERFIEGEDFYVLDSNSLYEIRTHAPGIFSESAQHAIVITETGYLMLVKSFTDDLAWQVQRDLVNKYFATPQPQTPPQSTALMSEVAETFKAYAEICECIGVTGNQKAIVANAATVKHTGINPLENMGLTQLTAETQEQTLTVSDIAKQLGIKNRQVNPILTKIGLQTTHRDHKDNLYYELTNLGKEHGVYLDTGKKHKTDGSPVRQIKWYDSAIDLVKAHLEADF